MYRGLVPDCLVILSAIVGFACGPVLLRCPNAPCTLRGACSAPFADEWFAFRRVWQCACVHRFAERSRCFFEELWFVYMNDSSRICKHFFYLHG